MDEYTETDLRFQLFKCKAQHYDHSIFKSFNRIGVSGCLECSCYVFVGSTQKSFRRSGDLMLGLLAFIYPTTRIFFIINSAEFVLPGCGANHMAFCILWWCLAIPVIILLQRYVLNPIIIGMTIKDVS